MITGDIVNVEDVRIEMNAPSNAELTSRVNIRAKFKPHHLGSSRENYYGVTSDAMRKTADYGHNYIAYNNGHDAVHAYASQGTTGGFMAYRTPPVWRLIDFVSDDALIGYNHQQEYWWTCSPNGTNIYPISRTTEIEWNLDFADFFNVISSVSGTASTLHFGFLMTQQALASATTVYWYQVTGTTKLPEITEPYAGRIPMYIRRGSTQIGDGTWHIIPAWFDGGNFQQWSFNLLNKETTYGNWYMFPFCENTDLIVVADTPVDDPTLDKIGVTISDRSITSIDPSSLTYRISKLDLAFTNSATVSIPIGYSVNIVPSSEVISGGTVVNSAQLSVPTSGTTSHAVTSSTYHDFSLATSEVEFEIRVWLQSDPQNYEAYRYPISE